ncbi:hypothetical protein GSY74_06020 [Sulfurovum sp. bin170]|uniref:hypothetical protein n=1 Tax=Sulfurovum sp. bin170 TaxID=2695268 RepID=UPI0013E06C65|nr:hypothetical protein [Sulfurovum sp. bin170]NEW60834.1 hypothetical protein [Sulfurovum sp. bin170]
MTHNLQINIADSLYEKFIAYIQSLPQDTISVQRVNTTNKLPQNIIISSKDEVRERVHMAEERINRGEYLTQEQYDSEMDDFFRNEFGIK